MSMSNSLINRMGPTFIKSTMKKTGASSANIARAYIIVREAFGLRPMWDSIEALDNKVPAELQLKSMQEIARLAEHAVAWFLTRLGRDTNISQDVKDYSKGIALLRENIDDLVTPEFYKNIERRMQMFKADGLPKTLAHDIAFMPLLSSACDIIRISLEQKTNLLNTAQAYFELGEKFHLDWLRQQARFLNAENHWQAEATNGLIDQFYSCQAGLTIRVLRDTGGRSGKEGGIADKWLTGHTHLVGQIDDLFSQLRRSGTVDLPMLVIAEQRLRNLYGG